MSVESGENAHHEEIPASPHMPGTCASSITCIPATHDIMPQAPPHITSLSSHGSNCSSSHGGFLQCNHCPPYSHHGPALQDNHGPALQDNHGPALQDNHGLLLYSHNGFPCNHGFDTTPSMVWPTVNHHQGAEGMHTREENSAS